MIIAVSYDVRKNKNRTRIFKQCTYFGLTHLQESLFVGYISEDSLKLLQQRLRDIPDPETDSLIIFSLSRRSISGAQGLCGALDAKMLLQEQILWVA